MTTALLASGSQLPSLLFTVTSGILAESRANLGLCLSALYLLPKWVWACQPCTSEGWSLLSLLPEDEETADITSSIWSCCLLSWDLAKPTCELAHLVQLALP